MIAEGSAIQLPDAPDVPGLSFRRYRGEADHPAMVAVLNAANEADRLDEHRTVEQMTADYRQLSNCNPYRDVLIAEVAGQMVAYGRVYWADDTGGGRIYESFCFVDPRFRQRGIGLAMLHHNQRRLRRIASAHQGIEPRRLSSGAADSQVGALALLLADGYRPVRYSFDMERPTLDDLPDAPLPEGLEIRPVQPEHLRRIWEADVEAFRDHWGEHDASEESYRRFVANPEFDRSLWQVAWDGEEVAGLVINTIYAEQNARLGKREGWLDSVAVRRPWRRRGLARGLIARSLHLLRERGMSSAALGVDAENPNGALALYESVGFRPVRRYTSLRKPIDARLSFEERTLRAFIPDGRLTRLPAQQKKRLAVLAHIAASAFEEGTEYPESEVNERLRSVWGDVATLRRLLVDHRFMDRHAGRYRLRPAEWRPSADNDWQSAEERVARRSADYRPASTRALTSR